MLMNLKNLIKMNFLGIHNCQVDSRSRNLKRLIIRKEIENMLNYSISGAYSIEF